MRDNNQAVLRVLLTRGALPNNIDQSGTTALMYCAQYTDSATMCQLLIENGSLVDNLDKTKKNAMMYASTHDNNNALAKIREVSIFYFQISLYTYNVYIV